MAGFWEPPGYAVLEGIKKGMAVYKQVGPSGPWEGCREGVREANGRVVDEWAGANPPAQAFFSASTRAVPHRVSGDPMVTVWLQPTDRMARCDVASRQRRVKPSATSGVAPKV